MMLKRLIFTAALVLAGTGAIVMPMRATAAPIDALDRYTGTWQNHGTFVTTPYQKAGSVSGTTTCAWSNDHQFMICQQSVSVNDEHDSDMAIFTYDDSAKTYRFYAIRPAGAASLPVTVEANSTTFPISFTNQGKKVLLRTVNVWDNPRLYRWRTEYSTDEGKTWTLMGSGTYARQ